MRSGPLGVSDRGEVTGDMQGMTQDTGHMTHDMLLLIYFFCLEFKKKPLYSVSLVCGLFKMYIKVIKI